MVNSVTLRRPFTPDMEGTLCVTGHHLIISSRSENHEELWLLHSNVDSVEKKLSGSGGTLALKCKDFLILYLDIPVAEDCINVASSVLALSNIDDITLRYPFFFRPLFDVIENGWQAFSAETEFNRFKECQEDWRISYVNKDFKVCPTYPHAVFVPKSIEDETIIKAASFRQGGRFPVLSYYHKDSKTVLMRSSQPLSGPSGKRCKEDERLVNSVMGMGKRGFIVDTRAQGVAKMAQSKGGGFELEAHYPQWRRIHQPIERRTAFHDSLIKMIEACNDSSSSMDKWLSKLESSNWLTHVKDIITSSCVVAQSMDKERVSVLVHGSEGMDTTLLVSSLSQIILDHDCRTVTGFEALIEREWIQAGHPFRTRCNKSAYAITKHRQESPVFLLFIDCVWQIWQQFPCSFEFSEKFLLTLFQHAYSSQFGTFLCNNERERMHNKVADRTVSLWSYMNRMEILQDFMNPMYEPNATVIWPSVAPQSLTVWTGLYLRGVINQAPQDEAWQEIYKIREYDKELRSKVNKLRRQLASLEREAISNGVVSPPTPMPAASSGDSADIKGSTAVNSV
ncbi:myotubularin-related protein 9 [Plakobranchus ocellatus]|uniref:Myotubularin-related protein 9 n=1 Tax=Plakobranchus ocellatus TaxID=259542 RepID=A0AAV3YVA5_9GAST|nr:myotubularin-related protein 9 [Plakobranchus ocellatus]